eukprot:285860_1
MSLFKRIYFIFVCYRFTLGWRVHCVTEHSLVSGSTDGAETNISCSNSSYTLVSCGHSTVATDMPYFRGSWITGQTCFAKNGRTDLMNNTQGGVIAHARCCDLSSYSMSCNTTQSELALSTHSNERVQINASCSSTQTLMGCTLKNMDKFNAGCFPGDINDDWQVESAFATSDDEHSCIGREIFGGGGVQSYATCCASSNDQVSIDCQTKHGLSVNLPAATVSCPDIDHQFMTSCSGASEWGGVNAWGQIISLNGHELCTMRNTVLPFHFARSPFRAVAICCSISVRNPTDIPTFNPTDIPTSIPISNPSSSSDSPTLTSTLITLYPTVDQPDTIISHGDNVLVTVLGILSAVVVVLVLLYIWRHRLQLKRKSKMIEKQVMNIPSPKQDGIVVDNSRKLANLYPTNHDIIDATTTRNDEPMDEIEGVPDVDMNSDNKHMAYTVEGPHHHDNDQGNRRCVDCGKQDSRSGKVYDGDGLFYCSQCWVYYDTKQFTNQTTKGDAIEDV